MNLFINYYLGACRDGPYKHSVNINGAAMNTRYNQAAYGPGYRSLDTG
jgi:hypothetical protein